MEIHVRGLTKVFDGRTVLAIEQLDVRGGEVVALVGPRGSGKSLLLRLLCGEVAPSGGTVTLDGRALHADARLRAQLGVVFEDDLLYKRLSALRNLELSSDLRGLPRTQARELLGVLGISDQADTPVHALSRPAQRRLAFARALVGQPKLLLLDEPTQRCDGETQALFARLLTQAAQGGVAVLLAEETVAWAGTCCTRVVDLEDGRITADNAAGRERGTAEAPSPEPLIPFKVPARRDDRIVLYDPGEVLYATSRDGRTILRTAHEEATTHLTLAELEARLVGRGFFKAHRAYLVNLQHVKSVIQYTRNSYTLQLDDATMVPLSKQSEKELQALLGY